VAVLDPEHLFQQAEGLLVSTGGPVRQVNIRRAISAAYYGLFHALQAAAADMVVGKTTRVRATVGYSLVYRSLDHKTLRKVSEDISKRTVPNKLKPYVPAGASGFGKDMTAFATALVELQQKRHEADYDPRRRMKDSDARVAIRTARAALSSWKNIRTEERATYLLLLMFEAR
jgi:uncharacterized protein (UPF0332 family)